MLSIEQFFNIKSETNVKHSYNECPANSEIYVSPSNVFFSLLTTNTLLVWSIFMYETPGIKFLFHLQLGSCSESSSMSILDFTLNLKTYTLISHLFCQVCRSKSTVSTLQDTEESEEESESRQSTRLKIKIIF